MIALTNSEEVLHCLKEFDEVFPNNKAKVEDYVGWADKIYKNGYAFVLKNGNENIGLTFFYANDSTYKNGFITLIGVKKEYRKCGNGEKLLFFTLQFMKQKGMEQCYLEVDKDNSGASAFYKKFDFEQVEERESSYILRKTC